MSFTTGNLEMSKLIVENTKLFKITVSFGSVISSISLPCFMSHAAVPAEVRAARGLPDDLVRISAGGPGLDRQRSWLTGVDRRRCAPRVLRLLCAGKSVSVTRMGLSCPVLSTRGRRCGRGLTCLCSGQPGIEDVEDLIADLGDAMSSAAASVGHDARVTAAKQ